MLERRFRCIPEAFQRCSRDVLGVSRGVSGTQGELWNDCEFEAFWVYVREGKEEEREEERKDGKEEEEEEGREGRPLTLQAIVSKQRKH